MLQICNVRLVHDRYWHGDDYDKTTSSGTLFIPIFSTDRSLSTTLLKDQWISTLTGICNSLITFQTRTPFAPTNSWTSTAHPRDIINNEWWGMSYSETVLWVLTRLMLCHTCSAGKNCKIKQTRVCTRPSLNLYGRSHLAAMQTTAIPLTAEMSVLGSWLLRFWTARE
jgi:hypothetical protein